MAISRFDGGTDYEHTKLVSEKSSTSDTLLHNSFAEITNSTSLDPGRFMLDEAPLKKKYWSCVVEYVVYFIEGLFYSPFFSTLYENITRILPALNYACVL